MKINLRVSDRLYRRIEYASVSSYSLDITTVFNLSLKRWLRIYKTFDNVEDFTNSYFSTKKSVEKSNKSKSSTSHVLGFDIQDCYLPPESKKRSKWLRAIIEWRMDQDNIPVEIDIKAKEETYNFLLDENFTHQEKAELSFLDQIENLENVLNAIDLIIRTDRVSTSFLQRSLKVNYNRAAHVIDILEQKGFISPPKDNQREILITKR